MEAEKRSEGGSETGNKGNETTEILSNKQPNPFAGALHPTNSRVSIRPSDTPTQFNGIHLRASEMTPPPNGDARSVNGLSKNPLDVGSNMIGSGRGTWQERFSITGDMPAAYEGLQPPSWNRRVNL